MWGVCQTAVFESWWDELSEQEQDDVTAIVELLQEMGPQLPFPYSSGVERSRHSHMRELRIQSHGDPLRVFYAFDPNRSAILLIGGNKTGKDKRFYNTMIPKAAALYDEHIKTLQSHPKP
ncbi:MAG: type II toxin-antitoxin system RelE/ParE family toxin [Prochlorococcaceae cyanobacterium]